MIRGFCRTNQDGYEHEEWPTQFVAVPLRGERVRAKSRRVLWVVGVTHCMDKGEPRLEVELNKWSFDK